MSQQQDDFLALYQPIHNQFERYCRAQAHTELPYEDLMNDTLLVAYRKMNEIKSETSFLSFLIGISRRILANSRKKKRPIYHGSLPYQERQATENPIEKQFEVEFLHQCLAQLPALQQEALILFEITGFSIKEVSGIQSVSEAVIKKRLSRGRKLLREIAEKALTEKKTSHA